MVTRQQCEDCGCPSDLCDKAAAVGIPWLSILLLMAKYGPQVVAIIQKDLAAGMSLAQIVQDLLGLVTPNIKAVHP